MEKGISAIRAAFVERAAMQENQKIQGSGLQKTEFAQIMDKALKAVSRSSVEAANSADAFQKGDLSVGVEEVMMKSSIAQVEFQGAVQVRNKVMEAYKTMMSMQV